MPQIARIETIKPKTMPLTAIVFGSRAINRAIRSNAIAARVMQKQLIAVWE